MTPRCHHVRIQVTAASGRTLVNRWTPTRANAIAGVIQRAAAALALRPESYADAESAAFGSHWCRTFFMRDIPCVADASRTCHARRFPLPIGGS